MSLDIHIDAVVPRLSVQNKKQLMHMVARYAAKGCDIDADRLQEIMTQTEKEQSSGIGHGLSIMHLRLPALTRPYTLFVKLTEAISFDSIDSQPVDLVFMMASPDEDDGIHLHRLSALSRLMRNPELRRCLRGTEDSETLYALLNDPQSRRFAA